MTTDRFAVALRWIGRVWSILSITFVLAFAIGEAGSGPGPSGKEWVGLSLFPIGVCVGLMVGGFREAVGGMVALGCLIGFYTWQFARSGHLPRGPFFFLVAAPGLLFLVAGLLSRRSGAA